MYPVIEEVNSSEALVSDPRRFRHGQGQLCCQFSTTLVYSLRVLKAISNSDTVVLTLNFIDFFLVFLRFKTLLRVTQVAPG